MKRTINQLVTAIMALESKPLTFDSEKLLRRLRAEHDSRTACDCPLLAYDCSISA